MKRGGKWAKNINIEHNRNKFYSKLLNLTKEEKGALSYYRAVKAEEIKNICGYVNGAVHIDYDYYNKVLGIRRLAEVFLKTTRPSILKEQNINNIEDAIRILELKGGING